MPVFLSLSMLFMIGGCAGTSTSGPSSDAPESASASEERPGDALQRGSSTDEDPAASVREPRRIETQLVDCVIPAFIEHDASVAEADVLRAAGVDVPKRDPAHCYAFTSSVPESLRTYHADIHQRMIDYVGGYDRYVHVLYEPGDPGDELADVLQQFEYVQYDDGGRPTKGPFTPDRLYERRACLVAFIRRDGYDATSYVNRYSFCNQPNPLTDPDWAGDREMYLPEVYLMGVVNGWAHEYFHHVQGAVLLERDGAMVDDCCGLRDPVGSPAWFVEGQAIMFPTLFLRDSFDDLRLVQDLGLVGTCVDVDLDVSVLEEGVAKLAGCDMTSRYRLARSALAGQVDWMPDCEGFTALEEYRETGVCDYAVWEMFNFYLAYVTSPQTLFVDLPGDIWELGFDPAFQLNMGVVKEQAYDDFTRFMSENPAPPEGFFPEERLDELVDFWSVGR